jgi:hypothetical protein
LDRAVAQTELDYIEHMNNFEPASAEHLERFFDSLRTKSIDEIVTSFGPPGRELGAFRLERTHWDGKVESVEYRRALGFLGKGSADHILWVYDRLDGQLEFLYTVDLKADPYAKEDPHPNPV